MIHAIIVDDEDLFVQYFKSLIVWEDYGISIVATAKNGRDALELCSKIKVDVCFIDINMPILDGIGFSKHIKNVKKHIEIILITGHNEFEYAKQAIKIGVLDYILKPVVEDELIDVLSVLIERYNERNNPKKHIVLPENTPKKLTRSMMLAQNAKRLIDEKYLMPNITVSSIAESLYVNASYLRLVFKKEYDINILEYINDLRMKRAKELISSADTKLSDVAYTIGFNDAAYFSKCFKKFFGISPSEYSNIVHNTHLK